MMSGRDERDRNRSEDQQPSVNDSFIGPASPPNKPQPPRGPPPGNATREGDNGRDGRWEQKPMGEQNPRMLEYPTLEVANFIVDPIEVDGYQFDGGLIHRGVLFCNPDTEPAARRVYEDLAKLVNEHKAKFLLQLRPSVVSAITDTVVDVLRSLGRNPVFAVVLTTPPAGTTTDPACRHLMQDLMRFNVLSHWCDLSSQVSASVLSCTARMILNK
jgi:hypothetical protein